jgi:nucleoside-diphosphate-sugar epimerase
MAATTSAPTGLPCTPDAVDDFLSQPTAAVVAAVARMAGPFLVLGAGGKIGLHLTLMLRRALDQLGRTDRVVAVSRFQTLRDGEDFAARGLETIACDLTVPGALESLPDAPSVFYLAGVKFGTAASPELLRQLNVDLPRRVAARFRQSRIAAFSSGCVYPFVPVDSGGAVESTPLSAIGDYAASCIGRENAFAAAASSHGTAVALLRLNYSVEFRYGLLVDIAQQVLTGRPIDVTTGHVNVIWQADAVAHCIQALELAAAPATPINITGSGTLAVRDLAQRFGALFDREPIITGTEASTAWLNNATWSHRVLGEPPTSLEDMTAWIATWLRQGGDTWGKPTGFQSRDGRF